MFHPMSIVFPATLVMLIATRIAHASGDPGELVTDRPDQTESSVVIIPGYVQVETGLTYTDAGDTRTLELPTTLVRVGVVERLELRAGLPAYGADFEGNDASGATDSMLGAKIYLFAENGWRPETALLLGTSLPTGSGVFSSNRFDPSFRFSFAHSISDRVGLGYNLGLAWESSPTGSGVATITLFQYTVATGFTINDRWGAFIELFGDLPLSGSGNGAHSLDGGITYMLRENVQLDLALGVGLTDDAPDWFLTSGVSFRLPN